jgi:tetratricopeptide (TPR) repeat protein
LKLIAGILLLIAIIAPSQSPQSFDQLSQSAKQAYEEKRDDDALRLYAEAVKMRPDWAGGWWALGMINYELDHHAECRDALNHMVALDSSAVPGWAVLGLCEFGTKQYDLAFEHLKKAHMLVPPRTPGGHLLDIADYHLGLLLTKQGAFEVAQEVLVRVALRNSNNLEMMFASGVTSLRMPILPSEVPPEQREVVQMAGKAFWDLATQPPEQAETDFKNLLAAYPKFPNVHYFYGTFLAARHPELCAPEFLAELQIDPENIPARVQLALRYIVEGNTKVALRYAKEAVVRSPESVGAQLALGEALRAIGDDIHALAAYQAAARLDPVSPKVRLYLANAYRAVGRPEDSRREQGEYSRLKTEQQNWP